MADMPMVVGIGGTLRANSSTERALRHCLQAIEAQVGRTELFCGADLDLPMNDPHDAERTAKASGLIEGLRQADAVVDTGVRTQLELLATQVLTFARSAAAPTGR